jgi:hypothetical protein
MPRREVVELRAVHRAVEPPGTRAVEHSSSATDDAETGTARYKYGAA